MSGDIAKYMEETIQQVCEWKEVEILELNVREAHIHVVIDIPPKESTSEVIGILKGKTAIRMLRHIPKLKNT
jgi:putative transposase